ncbi:glucuronate isomerase [Demequina soli]|uniref:glucuronate isomerase n=1 Tax=Demequina soli TaxID=1638987 RepID=UPI0007810CFB|nr:glucuronate isomerase [Demequina soli]
MPTKSRRSADRLLPADPATRAVARELLESIADAPIISPHGHVPASWLARDTAFTDPASLLISHDHYITRLLHASGVPLEKLGVAGSPSDPREVWRAVCRHWHAFAGTASDFWMTDSLERVFGITEALDEDSADRVFDVINDALATPALRPRALFDSFGIEVLATTDDALDPLDDHTVLAADPGFAGRVVPTFRPDPYLDPAAPDFTARVERLVATGPTAGLTFRAYLDALRSRRAYFVDHGAVSADHGVVEPYTCELDDATAERLFQGALADTLDEASAREFRGHMLWRMAQMSVDDGLVMTVHAGVHRNHHTPTFDRFGPDSGHDIPIRTEFTANLAPLLRSFGAAEGFHLVLFTIDESAYSRELAPLAGFYPSVYVGAPWWFLDAPDAMARYRAAVTETAGFYRTSGFIDDTRAYLSIPARHDVARRADASFLARLVVEGRVSESAAARIMRDIVSTIPREVFKL